MSQDQRPSVEEYFMGIAQAVRKRANCRGRSVGSLIVVDDRIVSTGYNSTPEGMVNCLEGGCERCANRERFQSGTAYDLCICVHAEQNALLAAARFGISVQGGTVYTTVQPCFGCAKEMLQAKIKRVYYLHPWEYPDPEMKRQYERILSKFENGVTRLEVPDPDYPELVVPAPEPATFSDETGHGLPEQ